MRMISEGRVDAELTDLAEAMKRSGITGESLEKFQKILLKLSDDIVSIKNKVMKTSYDVSKLATTPFRKGYEKFEKTLITLEKNLEDKFKDFYKHLPKEAIHIIKSIKQRLSAMLKFLSNKVASVLNSIDTATTQPLKKFASDLKQSVKNLVKCLRAASNTMNAITKSIASFLKKKYLTSRKHSKKTRSIVSRNASSRESDRLNNDSGRLSNDPARLNNDSNPSNRR